jgi:hypothetical protein
MIMSRCRVYDVITNVKAPGMLKILARDAAGSPQCLVFWSCMRAETVEIGCTYAVTILSSAVIKASGIPKKGATPETKYFASYGAFNVSFGTAAEFLLLKSSAGDEISIIQPAEATILPSIALLAPIGIKAVLMDVTGIVTYACGRTDKMKLPLCEILLADSTSQIRVSIVCL